MIEAGIYDGDYLIVEEAHTAKNGEIVVALIDDEATVKTFYKEQNQYRLQPENQNNGANLCAGIGYYWKTHSFVSSFIVIKFCLL